MLSHCANSRCSKPFLKLREGRLFLVETDNAGNSADQASAGAASSGRSRPPQVERYWLCSECAAQWTLLYDREQGVALIPLRRPAASAKPVGRAHEETA